MNTGQQIFRDNIRTLNVSNPDNFMAPPLIRMGTSDRLNINFDIISDDIEYLRYRLMHCNADWQPSRLLENEFVDGFNEAEIDDYAFSSNTYIHYVNYNITVPNADMPIIASGNYLLQVYPESEPDNVILQARFSVSEEKSFLTVGMTSRTDIGTNSEYQQLFMNVDLSNLTNVNPYQDLLVNIIQNNRPETARTITHPIRVERNNAVFEHDSSLIFEAGNEYRRFETVRTDYPGMHVDSVKFKNGVWHAWLKPDESRARHTYSYDSTQHGRFKVDEYNSTDPDLSADYVIVHFTLDPDVSPKGKVFLNGDFTQQRFDDSNLMKYNHTTGMYEASMALKQGSYNYQYLVIHDNGGSPSAKEIEGNKYETVNEYLVTVFFRPPGARGDRLVGSFLLQ